MKLSTIALLPVLAFVSSCSSLKNYDAKKVSGLYQGITPCADCPGIKTSLTINPDFTYSKSTIYLESGPQILKSRGTWRAKNDSVIVLNENGNQVQYRTRPNLLLITDAKGQLVENSMANSGKLFKIDQDISVEGDYSSQKQEGISFFASGNEPFWSLELKGQEEAKFTLAGKSAISFTKLTVEYGEGVTVVKGQEKNQEMEVTIYDFPCVNDMSGLISGSYVEIKLGKDLYKGCGRILSPAFELAGNWNLFFIEGYNMKNKQTAKPAFISFKTTEGRVSGNFGCNTFGGSYVLQDDQLSFEKVFSTKMACNDIEVENKYSVALQGVNSYKIIDNQLQLYKDDKLILAFKR